MKLLCEPREALSGTAGEYFQDADIRPAIQILFILYQFDQNRFTCEGIDYRQRAQTSAIFKPVRNKFSLL